MAEIRTTLKGCHRWAVDRAYARVVKESRSGVILGASAYLCWGFFPLYWPLLDPAGSLEVLAHRFVWSMFFVLIAIAVLGRWSRFVAIARDRRLMVILTFASITIAVNWGGFIYGVTNGHVIETSLGYFINPLVTVLLGVFVLKETLRPAQWAAVGIGALAVLVLAVDYGRPPWIALLSRSRSRPTASSRRRPTSAPSRASAWRR